MISDSVPWKSELFETASRLAKRATQRQWTERSAFLVERDVMVGCYAIRKLLETPGKISNEARGTALRVTTFPVQGKAPDFWDAYDYWDYYDFDGGASGSLGLRKFCNQVIHSLIFGTGVNEDGASMNGIYVASDEESRKHLYFAELDVIVGAFRTIALDEVVHLQMERNADGVMRVVKASRLIPRDKLNALPNLKGVSQ